MTIIKGVPRTVRPRWGIDGVREIAVDADVAVVIYLMHHVFWAPPVGVMATGGVFV
jgi:hypothetical protein